jgi:tetratricopeptide (TPR) repeat protein
MFTKGNSEEVRLAFARGLELATKLNYPLDQVRLLGGLHVFHERIGNFHDALAFAQRCESIAKEIAEPAAISVSHSMLGLSYHIIGNQAKAHMHLEAALGNPLTSQRINMMHFGMMHFGFHYRNRARIALARNLWLRGHADQAGKVARQTVDEAAAVDHAVTLCVALIWASSIFLWTGDWTSAGENIERLIAHAARHSLAPYHAAGQGQKGELMVRRGMADAGIQKLRDSLEVLRGARYERLAGALTGALVEGLAMTRAIEQASRTIDEVITAVGSNGDMFNMLELLRIKGDILARMPGSDPSEAENCFSRSIDLASEQSAQAWELRTTTSLAQLWSMQGRVDEVHRLLSTVYGRFTEGFESSDLKAAKRRLDKTS